MYISTSYLNKTLKARSRASKKNKKENFNLGESMDAGLNLGILTAFLVISIVFFALELLLLFYCYGIVINCTKGGPERVIHFVLATVFTLPYALVTITFNTCSTDYLNNITH